MLMSLRRSLPFLAVLAAVLLFSSASAEATRITVANSGPPTGGAGSSFANTQGITSDTDLTDVEISIFVGAFDALSGTVWLSTQIGPGTNASHVIAQASLPAVFFMSNTETLVFSLPHLAAGTYYISLVSLRTNFSFGGYTWGLGPAPGAVAVGNVTGRGAAGFGAANSSFGPDSTLTFFNDFTHSVKVTAVPEPGTAMLLAGLGVCCPGADASGLEGPRRIWRPPREGLALASLPRGLSGHG
ncbi:MAG: PEP-CTERM sorting domain-containing protein [Deltaproteobacteria bacterium]|nr:PEP-CTERM sorting domain-containing protein [Deltaproteobacteria bacterium]MBW2395450.1 PEP-CTERM sorting domain-containing protein [Deltaproteobacteria bacterium]